MGPPTDHDITARYRISRLLQGEYGTAYGEIARLFRELQSLKNIGQALITGAVSNRADFGYLIAVIGNGEGECGIDVGVAVGAGFDRPFSSSKRAFDQLQRGAGPGA